MQTTWILLKIDWFDGVAVQHDRFWVAWDAGKRGV